MKNVQELFQNLIKFNQESYTHLTEFMKKQKDLMESFPMNNLFEVKNKEDYDALFSQYKKMFQTFDLNEFQNNLKEGFHSSLYLDTLTKTAEQMKEDISKKYQDTFDKISKMTEENIAKTKETFDKAKQIQDDFIAQTKAKMK